MLFNSLDANNLIPSLCSTGLEVALRELEQNALYHNRDGEPVFAEKMRTYFENVGNVNGGFVTRAGACLLYPEGGMPSTNNAVEATNRQSMVTCTRADLLPRTYQDSWRTRT